MDSVLISQFVLFGKSNNWGVYTILRLKNVAFSKFYN